MEDSLITVLRMRPSKLNLWSVSLSLHEFSLLLTSPPGKARLANLETRLSKTSRVVLVITGYLTVRRAAPFVSNSNNATKN